jgi:hypothetical protein
MIPIKDINPTERFPAVTVLFIIINRAVFIYEVLLGPEGESFIALCPDTAESVLASARKQEDTGRDDPLYIDVPSRRVRSCCRQYALSLDLRQ